MPQLENNAENAKFLSLQNLRNLRFESPDGESQYKLTLNRETIQNITSTLRLGLFLAGCFPTEPASASPSGEKIETKASTSQPLSFL
jgi:hypothetical protein